MTYEPAEPFVVQVAAPGVSASATFATGRLAYAEAARIRAAAETGQPTSFTDRFGHTHAAVFGEVRVRRWNPLINEYAAHARTWQRNDPAADALAPLPAVWHHDRLPADWYADH
jgi:hypothetical protein